MYKIKDYQYMPGRDCDIQKQKYITQKKVYSAQQQAFQRLAAAHQQAKQQSMAARQMPPLARQTTHQANGPTAKPEMQLTAESMTQQTAEPDMQQMAAPLMQVVNVEESETVVTTGIRPRVWLWVENELGQILEINLYHQIKELGFATVNKPLADAIVRHLINKEFELTMDKFGLYKIADLQQLIEQDFEQQNNAKQEESAATECAAEQQIATDAENAAEEIEPTLSAAQAEEIQLDLA